MRTELKSEGKRLPYVSVIVITKNNSKTIEDCIISLVNQSYSKKCYEVIFVDGQSVDGTDLIIKKYMQIFPFIRLFYENYGAMGYARNLGVKESKGEIIAFTDGDATVPNDWIEKIVKVFSDNPSLVALGGLDELVTSDEGSRLIDSWRRLKRAEGIKAIPNIKTANFAIKRDALISCGGFNSKLSHFDEAELMARLFFKKNVKNILYDPTLLVLHKHDRRSLTSKIKKIFNKSVIGLPVLFRPYMIRMALSSPLSAIGTSLFFVFTSMAFTILLFSVALGLIPVIYILFLLVFGVIFVVIYTFNMKRYTGKFESKIVFILMLDCLVRFVGTLFGLIRLLSLNIYRGIKNFVEKVDDVL